MADPVAASRVPPLAAMLLLTACAVTGQPKTAVEERAAQIVAGTCFVETYRPTGQKVSEKKIDTSRVTINSLRKNQWGWVSIAAAFEGFIGNVYYYTRSGSTVCGSETWGKDFGPFQAIPGAVTLQDLGGG